MKHLDFITEQELMELFPALAGGALGGAVTTTAIRQGLKKMLQNPATRKKAKDFLKKHGFDMLDFDSDDDVGFDPLSGVKAAEWYRQGRTIKR